MSTKERFLSNQKRYQPINLPQEFSDEEMARDWTLSEIDKEEVNRHGQGYRLFIAVQLCAVRLYGRFLSEAHDMSPRIIAYLNNQLGLPPTLTIQVPKRKATYTQYRKNILIHLGFQKFDESAQKQVQDWLEEGTRTDDMLGWWEAIACHIFACRAKLGNKQLLVKLRANLSIDLAKWRKTGEAVTKCHSLTLYIPKISYS
jgi:hypothetical protein